MSPCQGSQKVCIQQVFSL